MEFNTAMELNEKENFINSHKQNGIIGKYEEDGIPIIVKFINNFPKSSIRDKFPMLTIISWKYDGRNNNGFPDKVVSEKMIVLENALAKDSNKIYRHIYSRTGNNLKELVYQSSSQNDFIIQLNNSLKKFERFPIEIDFYEDKNWSEFKKLITDFSK